MGIRFDKEKTTAFPEVQNYMEQYAPNYQYEKTIKDEIFYKTLICFNDFDNEPCVIKLYVKRDLEEKDINNYKKHVKVLNEYKDAFKLENSPNIAPFLEIREVEKYVKDELKGGLLTSRQYFPYSLNERIQSRPYLTIIEKLWITYQMIDAVLQMHEKGYCHGDIKMENFVLSSYLSVFLTDPAPFKPAYLFEKNNAELGYYFGEDLKSKSYYLAPERFVNEKKEGSLTKEMDIFSLGCVIAEMLTENQIFDIEKIHQFKDNKLKIEDHLSLKFKSLSNEENDDYIIVFLKDFLKDMLNLNPSKRPSIKSIKNRFQSIIPNSFLQLYDPLNKLIIVNKYWNPDLLVGFLHYFWSQVNVILFNNNENSQPGKKSIIESSMNFEIINYIIKDKAIEDLKELWSNSDFKDLNTTQSSFNNEFSRESIKILLNYLLPCLFYSKYSSSKIVVLEMLKNFLTQIDDYKKMNFILPYFIELLNEEDNLVKIESFDFLLKLLFSINDNFILSSSDFGFYEVYVIPAIEELLFSTSNSKEVITLKIIENLDKICILQKKFAAITLRSKIHWVDIKKNIDKNNNLRSTIKNNSYTNDEIDNSSMFVSKILNTHLKDNEDFNKNNIKAYKNEDEFISWYDKIDSEFRVKLLKIIDDFVGNEEVIGKHFNEIQIILIRKFPELLIYFGKYEENNFCKNIITQFNKKDDEIIIETINIIPQIALIIDKNNVQNLILPCLEQSLELLITNINEKKCYALIICMTRLFEAKFIDNRYIINLYNRNFVFYLVHPNFLIRNATKDLTNLMISKLSEVEIYTFVRAPLQPYLLNKVSILNKKSFESLLRNPLNRVVYELMLIIKDEYMKTILKEITTNDINCMEIYYKQFGKNISRFSSFNTHSINNNSAEMEKFLTKSKISDLINNEFVNFQKKTTEKDIKDTFIGKMISESKFLMNLKLPKKGILLGEDIYEVAKSLVLNKIDSKDINNNSEYTNDIIRSEFYCINIYFKALDVFLSEDLLSDETINLNNEESEKRKKIFDENRKKISEVYKDWRPTGLLSSIVYENNGIDKILPIIQNKFATISSESGISLYEIIPLNLHNDTDISIQKISILKDYDQENSFEYKVAYLYDNSSIVCGTENGNINIYKIESSNSNIKLYHSWNNQNKSRITSILDNQKIITFKNKIIFSTSDGYIKIIDSRGSLIEYSIFIGNQYGLITCIEEFLNILYIGTIGGYVILIDLRLNCILRVNKLTNNMPIISIKKFIPNIVDKKGYFKDTKSSYLIINSASDDHEISFWNQQNMNCELVLKVNPSIGSNVTPLMTEIPTCNNEENICFLNSILINYNTNLNKKLNLFTFSSNLYNQSNQRIFKIDNIFNIESNIAHAIYSPIGLNDNANYVISGGNDRVIRFWDLRNDGINNSNNSCILSAPANLDESKFTSSSFGSNNTVILQSNEKYNTNQPKRGIGFGENCQYNGLSFNLTPHNEFDSGDDILKYGTQISDSSHKGIITDITSIPVFLDDSFSTYLLSSSWDGTVKLWK